MNDGNRKVDLRQEIAKRGRDAVVREEMIRLGFWTPEKDPAHKEEMAAALTELQEVESKIVATEADLAEVQAELRAGQDTESLIADIRKTRIERVRVRREQRRAEKTAALQQKQEAYRQRVQRTPLFLGKGVSAGLRFAEDTSLQLQERGLPPIQNAEELARAIGLEPRKLAWLCYHRQAATVDHYNRFTIPKRNGGRRSIASPKKTLRKAQQWVFDHVLPRLQPHTGVATAFRRGVSILDNARIHCGKAVVIRVDLKDFFPTITFPRIKGLFRFCGYNEGVATLLALICTESPRAVVELNGKTFFVASGPRVLPQGACTSPGLANYICRKLDLRLKGLADSFGFSYTRYADDLIFSHADALAPVAFLKKAVYQIVQAEGFTPNEAKTSVMRQHCRQIVTGILVNSVPRVSRRDVRRFRAIAQQCRVQGCEAVSARIGRDARSYLEGYLAFVRMVNPEQAERLKALLPGDGTSTP
jgi:hypothetical protein